MRLEAKYMIRKNGKFYKQISMHKSKFCELPSPVSISDYMTGKMYGIPSISTSCLRNDLCLARMKNGASVCSHCFAETTVRRYTELGKNLEANFDLLTTSVLPLSVLPRFKSNVRIARIESFGDVANVTQAINYINIIKVNPHVMFAWWSKNAKIVSAAIEQVGKPKNVILVESSEQLNHQREITDGFDKVFTVYDDNTIDTQKVNVNCGARSCDTCRRCYSKRTGAVVNERLK